jgi:hypothetical protein
MPDLPGGGCQGAVQQMSYEEDIIIDEQALDVEWLDQPRRMARYCQGAAAAQRALDFAKEDLDFTRSTIERAVRADPQRYGVVAGPRGITEDSIKAAVQIHEEYRLASRTVVDAKYEYDVAIGVVKAFDHRKSALERLVQLHGQNYFAGPSVPRDLAAERERRDRAAQARVRISKPSGPPPPRMLRRS